MNAIMDKLPALVQEELDAANRAFPAFASMHEGFAVLKEEVEEAKEAMTIVDGLAGLLWNRIRWNESETALQMAEALEAKAVHAAAELIQVAAMARKFQALKAAEEE